MKNIWQTVFVLIKSCVTINNNLHEFKEDSCRNGIKIAEIPDPKRRARFERVNWFTNKRGRRLSTRSSFSSFENQPSASHPHTNEQPYYCSTCIPKRAAFIYADSLFPTFRRRIYLQLRSLFREKNMIIAAAATPDAYKADKPNNYCQVSYSHTLLASN